MTENPERDESISPDETTDDETTSRDDSGGLDVVKDEELRQKIKDAEEALEQQSQGH